MAGIEVRTERALALRRLAGRSRSGASGQTAGAATALRVGSQPLIGLAGELLLGSIISALVAALIVGFSTVSVPAGGPPPASFTTSDPNHETGPDLDPRDPLVLCTQFATHTRCVREES